MRGLNYMQFVKKSKINFGDFKLVGIVSIIAMIILWITLRIYILYFNVGGNFNYAYISIIKQNYIPSFNDKNFENSKRVFFEDFKNFFGINLLNPLSIVKKEINVMNSTYVDESNLSSNMYNQLNGNAIDDGVTSMSKNSKDEKARILIYHTHTTEAFKPAKNDSFYEQYNIVGIGDVLKNELEKNYNIEVVHDKTIHNTSYLESYKRSGETLDKYLSEFEDFDLIIDLHRDSLDNKNLVTTQIENKDVAKIMFVLTKNNPNFLESEELAIDLTSLANDLYPGFARNILYYNNGSNSFNQTKSSKLVLIEVGAQLNTVEEAINSAKLLSTVIGEYLAKE